jgi:hypothetical protein
MECLLILPGRDSAVPPRTEIVRRILPGDSVLYLMGRAPGVSNAPQRGEEQRRGQSPLLNEGIMFLWKAAQSGR